MSEENRAKADKKTLDLIAQVAKQKAEIAKIERPNWRTNCSFFYMSHSDLSAPVGTHVNLHVESNLAKLIDIAGLLISREASYAAAVKELGLVGTDWPGFVYLGSPVEDWLADIKARIAKVKIGEKRKKLEDLEKRLNAIVSPELRAQLELEAIEKALG